MGQDPSRPLHRGASGLLPDAGRQSDNPALGRLCDDVRPGLHRLEHAKHVVFYRHERGGILVSRILHQRMLPDRHIIDDQDEKP